MCRRLQFRRCSDQGFTLIELLVAVSLLAVLLLLLFSAMRTGMKSWEAAERRIDTVEGIAQVERFLERIIRQAQGGRRGTDGPITWEDLDPRLRKQRGVFEGEKDRFMVVAPGVAALPRGLYVYDVFLIPTEEERGDLWVTIDPYRPDAEEVDGETQERNSEPRLLRENVEAFNVRYFGKLDTDSTAEAEWVEEWPRDAGRIPWLIEIGIVTGDELERPSLFVSPMIAVAEQ